MTKEERQEWLAHPLTREVFQELREHRQYLLEKDPARETAEATFREATYRRGYLEGLKLVLSLEFLDEEEEK